MANERKEEEEWTTFVNWELAAPPTTPTTTAGNENGDVAEATGELSPESMKRWKLSEKEKEKANAPKWDDVKKPEVKTDPFMGVTGEMMRHDEELKKFKKLSCQLKNKREEGDFDESVWSSLESVDPERLHEVEGLTPAQREELTRYLAWKPQRMASNGGE